MEPLYSVKTALTEEEFVRFNRFVAHSNKKNLTIIIVCGVIILAFAINDFVKGTNVPRAVGFLVGMLVCVWLFTFGVGRTAKRYYRQYVVKEGSEQTILFFDDHYEQSTSNANANIAYKQLTESVLSCPSPPAPKAYPNSCKTSKNKTTCNWLGNPGHQ